MAWLVRLLIVAYTLALAPHWASAGDAAHCAHGKADHHSASHDCCDDPAPAGECCDDAGRHSTDPCSGCDHGTGWAVTPAPLVSSPATSKAEFASAPYPSLSRTGPPLFRPPRTV